MVAIVDYGVGNLFSLKSSLEAIGEDVVVSGEEEVIRNSERIILPGAGAFSDAAKKLKDTGLDKVIIEEAQKGKPVMGICLGMQMLLEKSYEYGVHSGLGLIKGEIKPIGDTIPKELKIPHIGWNALNFKGEKNEIFKYLKEGDFVYFVHSYHAQNCPDIIATSEYGASLTAAVARGNVYGCQFHPEKSGKTGLKILKAFCETEVQK